MQEYKYNTNYVCKFVVLEHTVRVLLHNSPSNFMILFIFFFKGLKIQASPKCILTSCKRANKTTEMFKTVQSHPVKMCGMCNACRKWKLAFVSLWAWKHCMQQSTFPFFCLSVTVSETHTSFVRERRKREFMYFIKGYYFRCYLPKKCTVTCMHMCSKQIALYPWTNPNVSKSGPHINSFSPPLFYLNLRTVEENED